MAVFDLLKEEGLASLRRRQKEAGGQESRSPEFSEQVAGVTEEKLPSEVLPTLGKALEGSPSSRPAPQEQDHTEQPQTETEAPPRRSFLKRLAGLR
jgi:hypothetical protein